MTSKENKDRMGRLLGRAYHLWQDIGYRRLAQRGYADIRPAHSPVFRFLDAGGSIVRDLAARSGMTKQSMTYLVKDLVEKGYLSISPDPDDRRAKRIELTEKGEAAAAALRDVSLGLEAQLGESIGQEMVETLRAELKEVVTFAQSQSED